jgi:hypothetical protein
MEMTNEIYAINIWISFNKTTLKSFSTTKFQCMKVEFF